ncbi:MAG: DnaJ domain-containing protein [Leptolyngbya sp. SIO4C5]|uniref:J domain-containing protein n=1 Tax=Sphaerothrix gracilis TaxID=3151835 RepID=UPI0013BFE0D6|nr:DnaJ domain-containing protein [Leptolyngbya sp. SIO4C5]
MNITAGLFQLDFTDHYAVLGLPVEADAKQVRKRYLRIARKLHPDSFSSASESDKKQASEFLSKLVNPAYEKLSQEKEFTEYNLLLQLKGQQLKRQPDTWQVDSETARQMLTSSNIEQLYISNLKSLAEKQYESLDTVLETIGQISELNLVYLMRKSAEGQPAGRSPAAATTAEAAAAPTTSQSATTAPPTPRRRQNVIESYLNRAKEFEDKQDFNRAILELREALQSHPKNARCHHQLAGVYMRKGQPKMAKIHLAKVFELSPESELGKSAQRRLENLEPKTSGGKGGRQASGKAQAQTAGKSRGGLFGLFGGKKG